MSDNVTITLVGIGYSDLIGPVAQTVIQNNMLALGKFEEERSTFVM